MRGRPPDWAELPVQYVDYTLWQRASSVMWQTTTVRSLRSWRTGRMRWPGCLSACSCRSIGRIHRSLISVAPMWQSSGRAQLQQRVREVAREHNATTFMVMQAALAVLLAKLSTSSDVAVGFPIAGRTDPALDELIGFFVNTLVLRVDLAGDPTVADLVAQVRQRSLTGFENQDVPFEVLVERLNPTRSLTHHPLVQVMFAWQNHDPTAGLTLGDLRVAQVPIDTHTARTDLSFSLSERFTEIGEPAGITGTVEFRTDVFDTATVEALARAVAAGVGGDHRRPEPAVVVDRCARCRRARRSR